MNIALHFWKKVNFHLAKCLLQILQHQDPVYGLIGQTVEMVMITRSRYYKSFRLYSKSNFFSEDIMLLVK